MVEPGDTDHPPQGGTPSVWALKRCANFLRQFQGDLRDGRPRDESLENEELSALHDHLSRVIESVAPSEPEYRMVVAFGASLNFVEFTGTADQLGIDYARVPEVTCGRVANSGGKIASLLHDLAEVYGATGTAEAPARSRTGVTTVRVGSWRP